MGVSGHSEHNASCSGTKIKLNSNSNFFTAVLSIANVPEGLTGK
jgi:hypothetical protein